jgi:purine nucleosidase
MVPFVAQTVLSVCPRAASLHATGDKNVAATKRSIDHALLLPFGAALCYFLRVKKLTLAVVAVALLACVTHAQEKRKVIIDQDCAGPGGTDTQAILALIQSPTTDVLGITTVTGDEWQPEETLHALRLMEIIGRTDIPVVPGATFPLVNTKEFIARWETLYGKIVYQGAWNYARGHAVHGPYDIPPMSEGMPTTKPADEDAAHFLVRMVRKYPHQITIYEGGPLTNLALAQAIDPEFASLSKELILMGASLNPITNDPEFTETPRREFNLWIDPEASHRVLHSAWPRIVVTTVDISLTTRMEKDLIAKVAASPNPAAQYTAKYAEANYLWDELAAVAWLDPSIITKTRKRYLDVDIGRGAGYGDTLEWTEATHPGLGERDVEIQETVDKPKFYSEFIDLLTRPTPPPPEKAAH